MLLGRERERMHLASALHVACSGTSSTVLIRGEAGIGKSTLLDDAVQHQPEPMIVLRLAGVDAESELAFAGLHALLRPLLHLVDELPPPHAEALGNALSLGSTPTNPLAVGAATLGLLAHAAEEHPVLVAVDDAHWIDDPTARALGFALHRLDADRVAGLVTLRAGERSPLGEMGFVELRLVGLNPEEAHALMSSTGQIARDVADRCHEACGGNPLAIIEIGTGLDPLQRHGARALGDSLPIGHRLTEAFGARVRALSLPAQHILLIAALAGPAMSTIEAARAACGIDGQALIDAELAGIIVIADGQLQFAHPLLRAAVVAQVSTVQRRSAHQVLTAVLADRGNDPDRYSWHLASAVVGPDETAAAALEVTAENARARGAPSGAAIALERAARLSPDPAAATRRLIAAGDAHWDASGPDQALGCWRAALDATGDRSLQAGIAGRIGEAQAWFHDSVGAVRFLVAEGGRLRPFDLPGCVGLLVRASMISGLVGDMGRAVALANEAMALAAGDEGLTFAARAARALALVNHGDERDAIEDLALVDSLAANVEYADGTVLMFLQIAAFSQMVREDWDRARATLATVIANAQRTGMHAVVAFACSVRADIGWRTGRWAEARSDAGSAIAFSRAVASPNASFGHAVLARIDGCTGFESECSRGAGAAHEMATKVGMASLQMWADSALGLLHLGGGRPLAAVEPLSAISAAVHAGRVFEPGFLWWHADLAEAAIDGGVPELAEHAMADLTNQQSRSNRVWTSVALGRIRGLIDRHHADEHFESSLAAAIKLGAPFEQARTNLRWAIANHGRRPAKSRRDAISALEVFRSLGAEPWALRCESTLGLARADVRKFGSTIATQLTAAELRVALAIGSGASSREAADQLYVSVRTVEFHLNNIYRRLGVRSRTELALLVARERDGGQHPDPTPQS
jgi:DNA-binding CsgD family transcriptional regulator